MSNGNNNSQTIILNGVRLFWVKCDPENPADAYEADKPKRWEAQLRIALDDKKNIDIIKGAGLNLKPATDETDGMHGRLQVYKPIVNRAGESLQPVRVVTGRNEPLDPNIIGNGSIGNVRLHVYPFEVRNSKGKVTRQGVSCMLMAIQVTMLKPYHGKKQDFEVADYVVADGETVTNAGTHYPSHPMVDEDEDGEEGNNDARY